MNILVQDLSRQARALPPEDRALLAEELLASLQDNLESGVDAAWDVEIKRRLEQVQDGTATLTSSEEVRAQARRLYRRARFAITTTHGLNFSTKLVSTRPSAGDSASVSTRPLSKLKYLRPRSRNWGLRSNTVRGES